MKIVSLNGVPYGSTGKIAKQINLIAESKGNQTLLVLGWSKKKRKSDSDLIATSFFSRLFHLCISKCFGLDGFGAKYRTQKLVKKLKSFNPDIMQLHMMHSGFLHLPTLFEYIKKEKIPVVWTFHDCWAFTGGCAHFESVKCEKWKDGCKNCQLDLSMKRKIFDSEKITWIKKKRMIEGVDITVVTPSKWLAEYAKVSMFKNSFITVINNGIDLSVFYPRYSQKQRENGIYIILGVALGWSYEKGLDVFVELRKRLADNYKIILVGTDKNVEMQLPSDIQCIRRTSNQDELAEIYSMADVFVNPTREDNFPTVNIEALACGTPIITFNTGGSPEIIDETCGVVVEKNDINSLEKEIIMFCKNRAFSSEKCVSRAKQFADINCYEKYVELYEKIIKDRN